MSPILLITRPEPAAFTFADQARERLGCKMPVVISPLMRIEPTGDLPGLEGVGALIFTSRNGVEVFSADHKGCGLPCFAVGDATATAARQAGLNVASAGGNVDDLVELIVKGRVKGPYLHLRGAHTAGDVTGALRKAGLKAEQAIIYCQVAQSLSKQAETWLLRETPIILPLFSPRSARLLFSGRQVNAPLYVAAISENVAAEVPKDKIVRCDVAKRPEAQAVLECLEGLFHAAKRLEGGKRAQ